MKRELSWLDDLIPESKKKKEDDKKKKAKEVLLQDANWNFKDGLTSIWCFVYLLLIIYRLWIFLSTHFFLYRQNFWTAYFCHYLSTQEAQRMEVEGGMGIPYDNMDHLEIPVKTPKIRLVKVHSCSIQDILWNLTLCELWVSFKHPVLASFKGSFSMFWPVLLRQIWQRSLWHLIRGRHERSGWSFVCSQACLSSGYRILPLYSY